MTAPAPTIPDTPAQGAPTAPATPQSTQGAIDAARQRLAEGKSLLDAPGEAAAPAAGSAEAPPDGFSVRLEGIEERGEEPIELEAPDRETFQLLNQLQQDATLGRQVKAERQGVAQAEAELAEVEDMIAIDPTGRPREPGRRTHGGGAIR